MGAVLLLTLLISLCLLNIRALTELTEGLCTRLDTVGELCASGRFPEAEKELRAVLAEWTGAEPYTHIFLRHSETDGVTEAFYDALDAVLSREADSTRAALEALCARLRTIQAMDRIRWGSVF